MPTSVRLDPETEALLRRLARERGRTKSEIIRDALHRLATVPSDVAEPASLYQSVEDLVGIADNGPKDLAEQHKRRFRDKLHRRR
ncbi:MAG: ribbon-helix-helix protein, CopG family [Woeseiaceae bacterium]|nr:ribbon-helix-helix protein, CopG family [Woeseiaceae bacterium]